MNNKKIIFSGLVVVLILAAIIGIFISKGKSGNVSAVTVTPTTNLTSLGVNSLAVGIGCSDGNTSVACNGNTTALEVHGGLQEDFRSIAMTTATSTPCAFLSPAATSSLNYFSAVVSSSTAVTSTTYVLATSTTQYATSSLITRFGTAATGALPASAQGTFTWGIGDTNNVVNPSTYVVLGVQGGTGNFGTAAQVGGTCKAMFVTL